MKNYSPHLLQKVLLFVMKLSRGLQKVFKKQAFSEITRQILKHLLRQKECVGNAYNFC